MLQVWRSCQGIDRGIWKPLGKEAPEPLPEPLARHAPGIAWRICAEKFQPARLGVSKTLHLENDPVAGLFLSHLRRVASNSVHPTTNGRAELSRSVAVRSFRGGRGSRGRRVAGRAVRDAFCQLAQRAVHPSPIVPRQTLLSFRNRIPKRYCNSKPVTRNVGTC